MLLIPYFRKIPVGLGLSWQELEQRGFDFFSVVCWFFDKIGFLIECTPLYFFTAGFCIDIFIPRAQKIIKRYELGCLRLEVCRSLLKKNDIMFYLFWLLLFAPFLLTSIFFASLVLNFISTLPSKIIFGLFFTLFIHEFACPSSVRRWKAALRRDDYNLAEIINIAGPSSLRYFDKFVNNSKR